MAALFRGDLHGGLLQITSPRMAELLQNLAANEVGMADEANEAHKEEVSTEEEEVYISDPESSSSTSSTRDPRELRMVYVRYEVGHVLGLLLPDTAAGLAWWPVAP